MAEGKRGIWRGSKNIPHEIVTEILSRLPVESIMVCKSVCKSWNFIINDNYFIQLHPSNSNPNPSSSSPSHILFEACWSDLNFFTKKLLLFNVKTGKVGEIQEFPLFEDMTSCETRMVFRCSFDGLICFSPDSNRRNSIDPVKIFNPLLSGDYICLPESEIDRGHCKVCLHVTLGFDHSIKKYKVVRIFNDRTKGGDTLCEMITIGEKDASWRRVKLPEGLARHGPRRFFEVHDRCLEGVYHQGSIYWILVANNEVSILELDLTTEVFAIVTITNSGRSRMCQKYGCIRMFNGQLQSSGESLTFTEIDGKLLHIWRIVKQDTGGGVAGYRSIRTEVPQSAELTDLVYLNDNEDLLLFTSGGYKLVMSKNGNKIKIGAHSSFYRPTSKKKYLSNLHSSLSGARGVHKCYFKPSLVCIKEAMLNYS